MNGQNIDIRMNADNENTNHLRRSKISNMDDSYCLVF